MMWPEGAATVVAAKAGSGSGTRYPALLTLVSIGAALAWPPLPSGPPAASSAYK